MIFIDIYHLQFELMIIHLMLHLKFQNIFHCFEKHAVFFVRLNYMSLTRFILIFRYTTLLKVIYNKNIM